MWAAGHWFHRTPRIQSPEPVTATNSPAAPAITIVRHANASIFRKPKDGIAIVYQIIFHLVLNLYYTCAVKRRWSTAGESPARELGSLHPEAIGAAVEETKPSEPPV